MQFRWVYAIKWIKVDLWFFFSNSIGLLFLSLSTNVGQQTTKDQYDFIQLELNG